MFSKLKHNYKSIIYALLFPLIFFYYEIIFKLFTIGHIFHISFFCILGFSAFLGFIVYLPLSFIKNDKARYIVSAVIIGLFALPFLIEFFVFKQFKVFFDLNTVFGGAGGVVGSFGADIFRLIFSFDGISAILLYFLPLVIYLIFGKRIKLKRKANFILRLASLVAALIIYIINITFIYCTPTLKFSYHSEYNFQSAVRDFGFATAIRLDIKGLIFNEKDENFEISSDNIDSSSKASSNEVSSETPKVYGYNSVSLNFKPTKDGKLNNLNNYVSSITPSKKNKYTGLFKGKNLVLISAEAFSAEAIDEKLTPTLYRLHTKGMNFKDYYQPASAGTTGGEYQNIFGMAPTAGGMSFKNTATHYNYYTMGTQLNKRGYYGKTYHNNSYTYYGRDKTHINLGYSDGYMGYGNGMEKYVKNVWPQSDLEMLKGTLPTYIDKEHFNIYYMSVSGHSGYTRQVNSMTSKNWDKVKDLDCSDTIKGYYAANLELEYALEYLVSSLEEKGIADNTVICLTNDHFPYGLDKNGKLGDMPYLSELYGYAVNNLFERDHSALILWSGSLEKENPIVIDTPTFSIDILPTLFNLFDIEFDSRLLPGRDVFSDREPLVFNLNYDWKTELGTYFSSSGKFIPKDENTEIPDDYVQKHKAIVRNKIKYCAQVLDTDYFRYLFK